MGRIVVFTSNDINSKAVLAQLNARQLPYTEINLEVFPSKIKDLQALTGVVTVPQVFFNTRLVGGIASTQKELSLWDTSLRYATPRDRYEKEVAKFPDPINPNLAMPRAEDAVGAYTLPVVLPSSSIRLPDGTETPVHDITEKLLNTLPVKDVTLSNVLYNNTFDGKDLRSAFVDSMGLSAKEAEMFLAYLDVCRVIHHLGNKKSFTSNDNDVYRLQCYMAPDVLNTFCFWSGDEERPIVEIVDLLMEALNKMEVDCVDDKGNVDYAKIKQDKLYLPLQETICELQEANLEEITNQPNVHTATALNIYILMVRFAFAKIGIPETEQALQHFNNNLKFKVCGHLFTLTEWANGILRGTSKPPKFDSNDPRATLALQTTDPRVVLAMNSGPVINGSYSLPFCKYTAANLDKELAIAAQVFCDNDNNVMVDKQDIKMSKVFEQYRSAFPKGDKELILWCAEQMGSHKRANIIAAAAKKGGLRIKYVDRSWFTKASNYNAYDKKSIVADATGMRAYLKRFRAPRFAKNEGKRLETLRKLNLLDSLPEERFDRITRSVQQEFDMPIVLVTLIDEHRQWFKSNQWQCPIPKPDETGRDVSFCGHAILGNPQELLYIEDATKDDRFKDNPFVSGPFNLRFYCGCPLDVPSKTGDGTTVNIGTLCMMDLKPRKLTFDQRDKIFEYTEMIKKEIKNNY